ncbi:MAG: phosphoglycerate transporter [Dehalococcoidia bacterium]|nr:phosphoglycerate transporter [Dehalococcoidia bacterium]
MYRIGWFSTGRGEGSRKLLETVWSNIQSGTLNVEIPFVFCNREKGEAEGSDQFIEMVKQYDIPLFCLSFNRFKNTGVVEKSEDWRKDYDREIMHLLGDFHPDISILAGYMLIVGREMCQKYDMVNLHPASPGGPKGTWREVIWQLIEEESQESGVMLHLVTPELDRGPAVTYCTFPIYGEPFDSYWQELKHSSLSVIKKNQGEDYPLFKLIRQHGFVRELPLIISTIKTFSEGNVRIDTTEKLIVDKDGNVLDGYDLSEYINEMVT